MPVLSDGNILVDGGLVNNLPGDVMRSRAYRTLIVIDVGSEHEFTFKLPEFPSPWQFLRSRILPFAIGQVHLGRDTAIAGSARQPAHDPVPFRNIRPC